MEQLTLILLVLPAMFVSSIIALAYIFKRLDHVQIPMFFKRCIIFLLYLIYAYVMLSLSYLLLGHYSYTFVLETFIAFYFFPKIRASFLFDHTTVHDALFPTDQ